jgi:hypothetical protein
MAANIYTVNRNMNHFSDEELKAEIERRDWERSQINWRIYTGELEVTDADGVVTMTDLQ